MQNAVDQSRKRAGDRCAGVGVVDDCEGVVDSRTEAERDDKFSVVESDRAAGSVDLNLVVLRASRRAVDFDVEIPGCVECHVAVNGENAGTRSRADRVTRRRQSDVTKDRAGAAEDSARDAHVARNGADDVQPPDIDRRQACVGVCGGKRERSVSILDESTRAGNYSADVAVGVSESRRDIVRARINCCLVVDRAIAVAVEIRFQEDRPVAGRQSAGRIRRDIVVGLKADAAADRRERRINHDVRRCVQND